GMNGYEREHQVLMQKQTIRLGLDGRINPRAKPDEGLEAGPCIHPHAEVDDDEIRIGGQVNRAAFDVHRGASATRFYCSAGQWKPPAGPAIPCSPRISCNSSRTTATRLTCSPPSG